MTKKEKMDALLKLIDSRIAEAGKTPPKPKGKGLLDSIADAIFGSDEEEEKEKEGEGE